LKKEGEKGGGSPFPWVGVRNQSHSGHVMPFRGKKKGGEEEKIKRKKKDRQKRSGLPFSSPAGRKKKVKKPAPSPQKGKKKKEEGEREAINCDNSS